MSVYMSVRACMRARERKSGGVRPLLHDPPTTTITNPLYNSKALRPSYLGIDVMYWAFVRPLELLGVFWDVKIGACVRMALLAFCFLCDLFLSFCRCVRLCISTRKWHE